MGSPTRELTPEEQAEERKLLQELVDRSFERFKNIVPSGRPKLKADDDDARPRRPPGRSSRPSRRRSWGWSTRSASSTTRSPGRRSWRSREPTTLRCVKYDEPPTSLSTLLGAEQPAGRRRRSSTWPALLDLTAPRAYYLCTWLPSLLSNRGSRSTRLTMPTPPPHLLDARRRRRSPRGRPSAGCRRIAPRRFASGCSRSAPPIGTR